MRKQCYFVVFVFLLCVGLVAGCGKKTEETASAGMASEEPMVDTVGAGSEEARFSSELPTVSEEPSPSPTPSPTPAPTASTGSGEIARTPVQSSASGETSTEQGAMSPAKPAATPKSTVAPTQTPAPTPKPTATPTPTTAPTPAVTPTPTTAPTPAPTETPVELQAGSWEAEDGSTLKLNKDGTVAYKTEVSGTVNGSAMSGMLTFSGTWDEEGFHFDKVVYGFLDLTEIAKANGLGDPTPWEDAAMQMYLDMTAE